MRGGEESLREAADHEEEAGNKDGAESMSGDIARKKLGSVQRAPPRGEARERLIGGSYCIAWVFSTSA